MEERAGFYSSTCTTVLDWSVTKLIWSTQPTRQDNIHYTRSGPFTEFSKVLQVLVTHAMNSVRPQLSLEYRATRLEHLTIEAELRLAADDDKVRCVSDDAEPRGTRRAARRDQAESFAARMSCEWYTPRPCHQDW